MSDTKHTPGPWRIDGGGPPIHIYADGCDKLIAEVGGCDGTFRCEDDEANAEFIVLACNAHDDLLAACEKNVELLSAICEVICVGNPPPRSVESLATSRAAIAKATGETQ